ncbi:AMP-binding protein [Microbulbifer hydrolyticus]|uniref:AMP-binding protein n=1 Tax=Microbulbifer hydrolyticus TaxID=48074 RepID=A0A6P1TH64_9GAMM|nr:AMP-binding protein [Microbulbifer hydrolyticus]MBB5211853.1 amino acid adenylation domain-containing protein [Microbulbifer hydrolyticus]QHQ40559.1 AMP-binding protein [Microbulbifer hydrolyticus]
MPIDKLNAATKPLDSADRLIDSAARVATDKFGTKNRAIPVIRQIELNAENNPDDVALVFRGQRTSYEAVISSARRIASGLKQLGVEPHNRVAVLMHPCPDLIFCLLGIHMLGATYVPIDPGFPRARIEMILEDIEPAAVICSHADLSGLNDKLSLEHSGKIYSCKALDEIGERSLEGFKAHPITLDDESHIFFTSGTTGRPKGAISSQENLAHGMSSSAHCFELESGHGILAVAGSSFSISTFELLSLLTRGGYTSIAERADVLSVDKLYERAKQVSVLHLVPTLLARLIEYAEQAPERVHALTSLERILTGGDNVPPDLLRKIRQILPSAKLYVNYGASETNCMVTYWPVLDPSPKSTRIGAPQRNVKLLVLDDTREPVSPGQIGELFVASPGVIPGYIHREDLNSEKFTTIDGSRYFATGDMVRTDENGLYEMLGREDFQIQLNGNRVELLEVESTLKQAPGIKDCVIAAIETPPEGSASILAAYIVADDSAPANVNDIKSFMNDYLPGYMVPTLYLSVESIPTNHNGKVDRVNLPKPADCKIIESNQEQPLSGPVEQCVATIWRDVLLAPAIHANSDFFELGGDSIKAVQAISKISTELDYRFSIADIISNTTVRKLSRYISDSIGEGDTSKNIVEAADNGYLLLKKGSPDLSPILLLNGVVEYRELAKNLRTDRAIYAVYLPEEVDLIVNGARSEATARTDSITSITQLYLSIIKALQPTGPYFLLGKSFGGIIAIEVGRELEKDGHDVLFTGLLDTIVPEAFTAHKKLSFRIAEHMRKTLQQGPGYLVSRLSRRYFSGNSAPSSSAGAATIHTEPSDNIRVRHQVRKNAIFTTRLSPVDRPLFLIKARDREYLYGERPSQDLGWSKYCEKLTVFEVPGDHHSILMSEHVANVARKLEPLLQ